MKSLVNKIIIASFTVLVAVPSISTANTLDFTAVPAVAAGIHNEAFNTSVISQYATAYSTHAAYMDTVNADYDRCMSTGSNSKECVYMKALGTENVNAMFDSKVSLIASKFTE
ncbi:TPA: hypothetical protein ACJXXT_000175 [Pseudomonas aeruginosa]|uniref:hypothetical protein n=1 Tax=Pseudomonas putida TaxID=303 RepID=UPI001BB0ACAE|nr:hypothetical protein [Pseudomonas putida]QUG90726.1 hypothetical protein GR140_18860 [Pseudomonas putida]